MLDTSIGISIYQIVNRGAMRSLVPAQDMTYLNPKAISHSPPPSPNSSVIYPYRIETKHCDATTNKKTSPSPETAISKP